MSAHQRKRRIVTAALAAALAAAAVSFFVVIPHEVDRRANALGPLMTEGRSYEIPALHASLRIADLHADTLLWDRDPLEWATRGHVDLPRLQQGNVGLQVFSVVTKSPRGQNIDRTADGSDNISVLALAQRWPPSAWYSLSGRALYQSRRLRDAVRDSGGQLRLILTRADLAKFLEDRAKDRELVGAILSIEGAHALEGDLGKLDALEAAGFRMLAPTHLFDSDLGGSQSGTGKGGLTELGRRWVAEMDRRRLIIDLAHASARTIDDVLALSSRAPLVSHTGVKGTCDNNRNLSDGQLRAVAAKGGLIGIGFWTEAVCAPDLAAVSRALRHAISVAGLGHVALGSDWDGFVTAAIDSAHMGWLTAKLVEDGFSEEEIRRVTGENALDFFARELP